MSIQVSISERLKTFLFCLYIVPLIAILVGIKDPVQWADHDVYLNYFTTSAINSVHDIFFNIQDPFFVILNKPFTWLEDGFEIFLFTSSLVTLTLKFLAFKKSTDNFIILLMLYSSYLLCLHDYIQIRIALSLSIMLFAIYYINNKVLKYILFAAGTFIHLSVGIIVMVYVFDKIFKENRIYFFLFVIIGVFFTQLISLGIIGGHRAELYAELARNKISYYDMNVFTTLPILQSIGLLYMFFKYKHKALIFEFYISLFGVIIFYLLHTIPVIASRTFDITMLFYLILLSRYFTCDRFIKIVSILMFFVGIKKLFYSDSALLSHFTQYITNSI
ncbi:EpsG family protein [Raoultella ornithinolytica]|uniref:EpsG family protein n=1 Tax=Raoultella ornithinolytica TaxID=54291 RepID=UPI001F3E42E5|nr:EpsG family protein [Raoultella ornithinolytica]MCF6652488.1 EpsG family protein [Raoultella ornithinolytica]